MAGLQNVLIGGYPDGGLTQDRKPLLIPDQAYSDLENAYVWRERTKKRDGEVPMGRLTRILAAYSEGPSQASVWNFNILTVNGFVSTTDTANPGKVTTLTPHNLNTGDTVVITGIVGATGYNNKLFTITVTSTTQFTVGVTAAGFGAYISGGIWTSNKSLAVSGSITGANNANPGQITTLYPHNLATLDTVYITGIVGAIGYNNTTFTITVTGINTFTVGVDAGAFGAYSSGGTYLALNKAPSIGVEPYAQIQPSSVIFTIGGITFTDNGLGVLTSTTGGNSGTINYVLGNVSITHTAGTGVATTLAYNYFPALPSMGILRREVPAIGIDSTVFFDTTYAYQYVNGFQELVPGETWTGTNTDFFWSTNWQGVDSSKRLFYVTNNNISTVAPLSYDPIRYYDQSTWTDFQPLITATVTLWQALIIIPYSGHMISLNTWEGLTADTYTGASNFFARARYCQLGNPVDQTNAWRVDIFGKGGFLDAPTNEAIVGAAFHSNTLIVFFEYSTWQLRFLGDPAQPFIWERISSDFGSISTFSTIIFDQGVMAISNRGIIQANPSGVSRLDDNIPEQVFGFEIQNDGPSFVHGERDFEKELVYWNYLDTSNDSTTQTYPNTVLVFNYKNGTWATFRDTITCFGPAQFMFGVTWDSLTASWNSTIDWDNVDDQQYVDYVTSGTQHGFINIYQNQEATTPQPVSTLYAPSMEITAVDFSPYPNPALIFIPSHNLENGEIIYITASIWSGTDPGLNNMIYRVIIIDADTITLSQWNQGSLSYEAVSINSTATYLGGGVVTLFPKMNIVGKDFNPFQSIGKQFKLSYIDFQLDSNLFSPAIAALTIQLFVNSYLGEQANLIAGNQELLNSSQNCGYITNIYTGTASLTNFSNPCRITSPDHSLTTGNEIYLANILGPINLNATIQTITVVDANNFTLNGVDATGFTTYQKGGIWNTQQGDGQTYIPGSQYAWYRFYSTQFGQYLRIGITYDDSLMNQLATHQTTMELNAMNVWFRSGGRIVN